MIAKTNGSHFPHNILALLPLDHTAVSISKHGQDKTAVISSELLRELLTDDLPSGAQLTAIFDSCHSGTLLDLDHYLCAGVIHGVCIPSAFY